MLNIGLNKVYKPAKRSKARYRIIFGGSGSGKSHYIAQEIILNMLDNGEYKYLGVRKTGRSIKYTMYDLLVKLVNEYGLSTYFITNKTDLSLTCKNGAKFISSGLDDTEKLKSIVGVNRIWVEEANEISEQDFEQLDLRIRGKNNLGYQITMSFNPISELHWLKKMFFDVGMEDSYVLKTTYKDNAYIDDAYIRKLEGLIDRDYQYYRIYAMGEWGSLGNLVFTNWVKEEFDSTTFDNYYNGVDFGFSQDPFAFIRVHVDVMRKTIYITEELYQTELHNDEASEILKQSIGREIVMCDSAEPKSIADLKRHDVNAKGAKKGKDSVSHGIKFIQGYKVIIHPSCVNAIKEFSTYKWREDKDGNILPKPVDMNNHLLDALRYALEPLSNERGDWGWK